MVPLVGGGWAEVHALVRGDVVETNAGEQHVENLSDCSRLAEVAGVAQAALVETPRGGREEACSMAAGGSRGMWLPTEPPPCADALSPMLPRMCKRVGIRCKRLGIAGPTEGWMGGLRRLKHDGPERVLRHFARRWQRCPSLGVWAQWRDLLTRHSQVSSARSPAARWPNGSVMVEHANTLTVQACLKGAGMAWNPETVKAMLVLRNAVCNDRWDEAWSLAPQQSQQPPAPVRSPQAPTRRDRAAARLLPEAIRWHLAWFVPAPSACSCRFSHASSPDLHRANRGLVSLGTTADDAQRHADPCSIRTTMNRTPRAG